VFAELLQTEDSTLTRPRQPIFVASSRSPRDQLSAIFAHIGTPTATDRANFFNPEVLDQTLATLDPKAVPTPEVWAARYPPAPGAVAHTEALDLLKGLLTFDKKARLTADQVLDNVHVLFFQLPQVVINVRLRLRRWRIPSLPIQVLPRTNARLIKLWPGWLQTLACHQLTWQPLRPRLYGN
jgi:hypothetical protein